jgi:hypothetical protein
MVSALMRMSSLEMAKNGVLHRDRASKSADRAVARRLWMFDGLC